MLVKKNRLSSRNAVRRSSRYGKQVRYAEFSLRYIDNNTKLPRLAVVVSKKVNKSAVKRNKIKRKVVEAYRQNLLTGIKQPVDLVVFVHNEKATQKSSLQLVQDLRRLMEKGKII